MPPELADGIEPFAVLLDEQEGADILLPARLSALYGRLSMRAYSGRPAVIANFAQTLDGIVTLDAGKSGGGPITGKNAHDRALMGLLRAIADAVIVGAGTARSVPKHLWTAEHISPAFAEDYAALRKTLSKPRYPVNVIVTRSGDLDSESAVLRQRDLPVVVITTSRAEARATERAPHAEVVAVWGDSISPQAIIDVVRARTRNGVFLSEAGPDLFGQFVAEKCVDDLFLTIAPQLAGRADPGQRPGLVANRDFAPGDPRWWRLSSVRAAGSYLFTRWTVAH